MNEQDTGKLGTRGMNIVLLVGVIGLLPALAGCGARAGALAYWMGVGRGRKIPAVYKFPPGRVLVLVDDSRNLVKWPQACELLARFVGENLLRRDAVSEVISNASLARLRASDPQFERRSAQEIGRRAGADFVLWLEVREFFAPQEIQDTSAAAKMSVSVKVLNVHEGVRSDRVRLWPADEHGHIEEVELRAVEVNDLEHAENAVSIALTRKLSKQVARLFFEYKLGELEDEKV
jgi:hypothetical protein